MRKRKRAESPADRVARLRADRESRQRRTWAIVVGVTLPLVVVLFLAMRHSAKRDAFRQQTQDELLRYRTNEALESHADRMRDDVDYRDRMTRKAAEEFQREQIRNAVDGRRPRDTSYIDVDGSGGRYGD